MPQEDLVLSGSLWKYCSFPCTKHWQKRLFFITSQTVSYTHEDGSKRKTYPFSDLIDVQVKDSVPYSLEFRLIFTSRNFLLRAGSLSQKSTWLQALRPKRRYTETHRAPSVTGSLELNQFLHSHPSRFLCSAVLSLLRRRKTDAWSEMKQWRK